MPINRWGKYTQWSKVTHTQVTTCTYNTAYTEMNTHIVKQNAMWEKKFTTRKKKKKNLVQQTWTFLSCLSQRKKFITFIIFFRVFFSIFLYISDSWWHGPKDKDDKWKTFTIFAQYQSQKKIIHIHFYFRCVVLSYWYYLSE